tara:strand:- start:1288 stop:1584 length:297 start_codon:yes stop_codon:yes gene_type:complete
MALFNFTFTNPTTTNGTSTDPADHADKIELCLNDDSISVLASEAQGLTIEQLFRKFAQRLGDVERIVRFQCAGQIVEPSDMPKPGLVYRGAVNAESKG